VSEIDSGTLLQEQKTLTAEIASLKSRINANLKYVQTATIKKAADLVRELNTKQARLTGIRNALRR
jgi:outer membrane murein-binding lipoprotein Lpp